MKRTREQDQEVINLLQKYIKIQTWEMELLEDRRWIYLGIVCVAFMGGLAIGGAFL